MDTNVADENTASPADRAGETRTDAPARRPWLRTTLRVAGVLVTIAVVAALAGVARRDGPAALAAWRSAHVRWSWIVLACACALAGQMVFVHGWRRMLTDCGQRVPYWQALRIYLVSGLGRYLPGGKAWQMGIVAMMAAERGFHAGTLAATSLLQGMVGVIVGALLLFATGGAAVGLPPAWIGAPVVGLVGLLLAPALLEQLPRLRSAAVARWPSVDNITAATMWALIWTGAASWLGWGLGLYALARGLLGDPGASIGLYVAAWIGPFIAGLLAVVTPAGLGVRDAAMTAILTGAGVNAGGGVMLVVIARVWGTLLEVLPAAVLLLLRRRARRPR